MSETKNFGSVGFLPFSASEVAGESEENERQYSTTAVLFCPGDSGALAPSMALNGKVNGAPQLAVNGERQRNGDVLTLVPRRTRCAVSMRADDTDRWGADDLDEKEEYTLSLKDPNVRVDLLEKLATFRRNRELCDCVLFVNEREIFAHKVVLAALSPALFDMFKEAADGEESAAANAAAAAARGNSASPTENGSSNNGNGVAGASGGVTKSTPSFFEFEQTDYDCFDALVNFAYTASLEISSKKVAELYKTAYSLRMMPVVKACATYLADNLSIANCIGIRKQANFSGDTFLMEQVDVFIAENVDQIVDESVEFTQLQCIKTRIIVPLEELRNESLGNNLADRALQYFADWQRKNPQCEHPLEQLLAKTHLLYVEEDRRLADCTEMDERSSVGSCDIIHDYKKSVSKENANGAPLPDAVGAPPVKHRVTGATPVRMNNQCRANKNCRYSSTESLDSVCSSLSGDEDVIETRLLAVKQTSDQFWVALVVLCRRLVVMSLQLTDDEELAKTKPNGSSHHSAAASLSGSSAAAGQSGAGLNGAAVAGVDSAKAQLLARLVTCTGTARTPLAAMHDARCSVGAAFVHGKIIVCGGYDRGECLRTVEEYDIAKGEWKSLAPMKEERGRFDAAVLDLNVYAIAGSNGNNDLRSCEMFSPKTGKWNKIKSLEKPRSHNGCATLDGLVYTVGGSSDQTVMRLCERYNPANDSWETIAPLEVPRFQAGVFSWRGMIIAAGGCDRWTCTDSVEAYDPKTNSWRLLSKLRTPRRGCGIIVHRDALYVIGGHDGTQSLSSVEVLDNPNGNWRPGPSLTSPRANTRAVVTAAGVVYVIGGFNGNQFLNTIELLENETIGWRNWRQSSASESIREAEEGEEEEEESKTIADSASTPPLSNGHSQECPESVA